MRPIKILFWVIVVVATGINFLLCSRLISIYTHSLYITSIQTQTHTPRLTIRYLWYLNGAHFNNKIFNLNTRFVVHCDRVSRYFVLNCSNFHLKSTYKTEKSSFYVETKLNIFDKSLQQYRRSRDAVDRIQYILDINGNDANAHTKRHL